MYITLPYESQKKKKNINPPCNIGIIHWYDVKQQQYRNNNNPDMNHLRIQVNYTKKIKSDNITQ